MRVCLYDTAALSFFFGVLLQLVRGSTICCALECILGMNSFKDVLYNLSKKYMKNKVFMYLDFISSLLTLIKLN